MLKYLSEKYGVAAPTFLFTLATTSLSILIATIMWNTIHPHDFRFLLVTSMACPILITPPIIYLYTGLLIKLEESRKRLNSANMELRQALAEIKTLSGLLPICTACKKIRDDKGYWNQIETYLHDQADIQFSHSICPVCAKNLYPGMDLYPKQ